MGKRVQSNRIKYIGEEGCTCSNRPKIKYIGRGVQSNGIKYIGEEGCRAIE